MNYLNSNTLLILKIDGPSSIYHTGIKILEMTVYRAYKILSGKPNLFAGKLFMYF
jgi:hypothetical protein